MSGPFSLTRFWESGVSTLLEIRKKCWSRRRVASAIGPEANSLAFGLVGIQIKIPKLPFVDDKKRKNLLFLCLFSDYDANVSF